MLKMRNNNSRLKTFLAQSLSEKLLSIATTCPIPDKIVAFNADVNR
jgi:hypothetical protein